MRADPARRIEVRPATEADYLTVFPAAPPEPWLGMVAVRDDKPVAFGTVAWTPEGIACGYFDRRGDVPVATMHRTALRVIEALRQVGESELFVGCDYDVPGAQRWLFRLGFKPVREHDGLWRAAL